LKMDLTEGFETSANINQTLGKHPKVNTVNIEHSESLKSKMEKDTKCRLLRWDSLQWLDKTGDKAVTQKTGQNRKCMRKWQTAGRCSLDWTNLEMWNTNRGLVRILWTGQNWRCMRQ
jgi:hypothetical protein